MDKETRLRYGETVMTHAMVFTAYDKPSGADHPMKWRVENSYAQTSGDKGYMVMTDTCKYKPSARSGHSSNT